MRIKSFAVIDTNVLVSAMISRFGFPDDIVKLIDSGNVILIFDEAHILKKNKDI